MNIYEESKRIVHVYANGRLLRSKVLKELAEETFFTSTAVVQSVSSIAHIFVHDSQVGYCSQRYASANCPFNVLPDSPSAGFEFKSPQLFIFVSSLCAQRMMAEFPCR